MTSIGDSAFFNCFYLKRIKISPNVTEISKNAFYGCYSLTIYGYFETVAEEYANQNSINFIPLNTDSVFGDPSGDQKITVEDALLILKYSADICEFTPEQIKAADVNGDGVVTPYDALLILQYEAEIITEFPVTSD